MEWTDSALHERPNLQNAIRIKLMVCGYLGLIDEARPWIARLLALNPSMTLAGFRTYGLKFLSPEALAICEEGLRRAGLPEGQSP
jgi:hypothetical protein